MRRAVIALLPGSGATAGSRTCQFGAGADDEVAAAPSVDVSLSAAGGASLADVVSGFTGVTGLEEEPIELDGADEAALVVRDSVVYSVVGSSTDVREARRVALEALEAALAG